MTILDFILIFILAVTTAAGLFFGLVRVLGGLITIIISLIIAGSFFENLAIILKPYLLDSNNLAKVTSFIIIYWVCSLFLSFVVKITNKIFNLPVLKTVNRLLGAAVSGLGITIVLSVFFYLFNQYAWAQSIQELIQSSSLGPYFVLIGKSISLAIPGI